MPAREGTCSAFLGHSDKRVDTARTGSPPLLPSSFPYPALTHISGQDSPIIASLVWAEFSNPLELFLHRMTHETNVGRVLPILAPRVRYDVAPYLPALLHLAAMFFPPPPLQIKQRR